MDRGGAERRSVRFGKHWHVFRARWAFPFTLEENPRHANGYANAYIHWLWKQRGPGLKKKKNATTSSRGAPLAYARPYARVSLFRERSADRGARDRSRRGKADYKERGILGGSIQWSLDFDQISKYPREMKYLVSIVRISLKKCLWKILFQLHFPTCFLPTRIEKNRNFDINII